ncbi:DUF177 domain-containing protein [Cyanobium sp. NIES-981]|uniref:YceD family protein n=1 Tax=Cyanobium sp. NIES-981 TaxID=1851505 RepID=UPI0007DCC61E|nr:YceD family protein [Cyanobium sp. NIES-981]SBO43040.1 conserved protein of unknown function [Cyanobium sp. NIES-981]
MSTPPSSVPAGLRPVPIRELQGLEQGRAWRVDEHLAGLASLTPVRGTLRAVHRGNLLEVEGQASTIVTLCCDRCLQQYNHALAMEARELIWLGEAARQPDLEAVLADTGAAALDLDADSLTESLDPRTDFDPAHWIFEQLSLRLPLVNRCGEACPGPATWGSAASATDPRWAALTRLRPVPEPLVPEPSDDAPNPDAR